MDVFVAAAHILGAFIVQSILSLLWLVVTRWMDERAQASLLRDVLLDLDLKPEEPTSEETEARVRRWFITRYNSELFRNRLSDLFGIVRTVWDWGGLLIMFLFYVGVVWTTCTTRLEAARAAWLIIPLWLGLTAVSMSFAIVCKFATGRFPGQARKARKELSKLVGTSA